MALSGVIALAVMPSLRAATHFCDSFTSKTDPAWGDQDGVWTIAKPSTYATAPSNAPLTYTDLVSYQTLSNFTLSLTVNDVYDGGIWLRSNWNGAANGVLLVVGGAYSKYTGLYWHIVTNSVVSCQWRGEPGDDADGYHLQHGKCGALRQLGRAAGGFQHVLSLGSLAGESLFCRVVRRRGAMPWGTATHGGIADSGEG